MSRRLLYTDRAGIYGAEQWTHRLALALLAAGHEVMLAQPRAANALVDERQRAGVRHCWMQCEDPYVPGAEHRLLDDTAEPRRVLDDCDPELIVFADSCPVASLAAKLLARERGLPYLVVVHCVTPEWAERFAVLLPALESAYRGAGQVIAVCSENLALLHRHFGLEPGKGEVVANGRPAEFFAPRSDSARQQLRAELGIPRDAVVCLTIGRFELVKGYAWLLSCVQQLQVHCAGTGIQFLWVGSGTLEPRLRMMLRVLHAEARVHVLAPRADVLSLLDASDIFVLPSRFEGMPLVVLEAMAKGLPVVATAVSGTPEALGSTGRLLPDPAGGADIPALLTREICELARDPAARRALGQAAHARAHALFREERMLERYLDLVRQALEVAE